MISVVKGIFFRTTDFNFRKIEFSGPTKQHHFRKIFSGVWKRRRKTQIQKTQVTTQKKKKSLTTKMFPVRRPRRQSRFEIAINGAIAISDRDRADDRDIGLELELAISDWSWSSRRLRGRRIGAREIDADWSSEFAGDRRTDWIFSSRARALSLSLSLSFSENALKGK